MIQKMLYSNLRINRNQDLYLYKYKNLVKERLQFQKYHSDPILLLTYLKEYFLISKANFRR
jgi:hypothetical protein